jgi:polyisoprenoid-binding protein YceI
MSPDEQVTTALPIGTWRIDPVHSTVGFEVRDMQQLVATIHGRFTDYEGTLSVHANEARASAAIRVASIATDQEQRDADLRSVSYLDATGYPEIRFESDEVEALDGNRVRIAGRLELKGAEQPVEFEGRVLGTGEDHSGQQRLAIAGESEVPFGPLKVKLLVDASAIKQD